MPSRPTPSRGCQAIGGDATAPSRRRRAAKSISSRPPRSASTARRASLSDGLGVLGSTCDARDLESSRGRLHDPDIDRHQSIVSDGIDDRAGARSAATCSSHVNESDPARPRAAGRSDIVTSSPTDSNSPRRRVRVSATSGEGFGGARWRRWPRTPGAPRRATRQGKRAGQRRFKGPWSRRRISSRADPA